ncbi:MAG: glycosyltransferase family 4 protein [Actinomycetota bacterium]|nr:glycosyltransferase family 4 protein [Actinomycetota bacterium]
MRVSFVNLFYPPDVAASGSFVASVAERRAAMGDEVTVICGSGAYLGRGPTRSTTASVADTQVTSEGPRVLRLWTPGLGKASTGHRLADYLSFLIGAVARLAVAPRQDVVVALTSPPYALLAAVVHRLVHPRTRVVYWCHDVYPDAAEEYGTIRAGGMVSRVLRSIQRWLLRRTDHVIALDDAMLRRTLAYRRDGFPPGSVIPNWEPMSLFPREQHPAVWDGYEAPELAGRFVVLYLGNLGYGHPTSTITRAAEDLAKDGDVTFLFVGGGVRYPKLAEEVRRRRLDDVVLRGYVPKETTPSVLAGAGCALISLDDGSRGIMSPCKLHGALASGVPVVYVGPVGTNVDEAIERYACGFSLRHGDGDGLADAVRRLRDDPELAAELSRNARRAFEDAYCDERTLPLFDEVFDHLSEPRPLGSVRTDQRRA